MRKLTHYELIVLMKNEINALLSHSHCGKLDVLYIEGRAQNLREYVKEYNALNEDTQ